MHAKQNFPNAKHVFVAMGIIVSHLKKRHILVNRATS